VTREVPGEDLFAEFTRLRRELSRLRARAAAGLLDAKGRARLRFVKTRAEICVERLRARRSDTTAPGEDVGTPDRG
jgi:ribosomal protein L29